MEKRCTAPNLFLRINKMWVLFLCVFTCTCSISVCAGGRNWKLSQKKLTLGVDECSKLSVKNADGEVTWASDNPRIAKVNRKGKVTGVKKGNTVISAACNGTTKRVRVKVTKANAFYIRNGVLLEYRGNRKKVVIPKSVSRIAGSAFETREKYPKDKIREIVVPGTVRKIDAEAFAFCYADKIVIEEGVKRIGKRAFMDSYIDEIHFPASVMKAGEGLMDTEEGLRDTKIYVKQGSYMEELIWKQDPYGSYEIIFE